MNMLRKNIVSLWVLVVLVAFPCFSQDEYNTFTSRNFVKFNSFFTIPTFSVLHRDNQTIEAVVRNSNIIFEDAPRLHILSYSGKMKNNKGAGIAVYQQEVGAFKDFGALANYAHNIKIGAESNLAFGFNFLYSRRSLNEGYEITQDADELVSNFQDIPIVNFQPALTFSYSNFEIGLFFENLVDFNLKQSELITPFSDKTMSAHMGYSTVFNQAKGLLQNTLVRGLGIVRRSKEEGFSYGGNIIVDLPKAGWIKGGYDKLYGLSAGIGVNLSERLSIGFSYEKQENLGDTNEIGLLYTLGKSRRSRSNENRKKPNVEILLPDAKSTDAIEAPNKIEENIYEDPEHDDLSDELQRAQDSINRLHKKVDEILNLLKNQPKQTEIIREIRTETKEVKPSEPLDTSLRRSKSTPWRESQVTRSGGGAGTMYYVALDQFKDLNKAKALVALYKKRKIKVKYVRDPKTKAYFVYEERYGKKEDAERVKEEINTGGGFENDDKDDLQIKVKGKKKYKDPVYVVKITFGASGETYKEAKRQPRARVKTMELAAQGVSPGYYLQVNVYSKKPYADKFLDELRTDGIDAGYFINPKTGLRHVYILKTDDRAEAIRLYNNNLNGTYYDRKSIVNIQ